MMSEGKSLEQGKSHIIEYHKRAPKPTVDESVSAHFPDWDKPLKKWEPHPNTTQKPVDKNISETKTFPAKPDYTNSVTQSIRPEPTSVTKSGNQPANPATPTSQSPNPAKPTQSGTAPEEIKSLSSSIHPLKKQKKASSQKPIAPVEKQSVQTQVGDNPPKGHHHHHQHDLNVDEGVYKVVDVIRPQQAPGAARPKGIDKENKSNGIDL